MSAHARFRKRRFAIPQEKRRADALARAGFAVAEIVEPDRLTVSLAAAPSTAAARAAGWLVLSPLDAHR